MGDSLAITTLGVAGKACECVVMLHCVFVNYFYLTHSNNCHLFMPNHDIPSVLELKTNVTNYISFSFVALLEGVVVLKDIKC